MITWARRMSAFPSRQARRFGFRSFAFRRLGVRHFAFRHFAFRAGAAMLSLAILLVMVASPSSGVTPDDPPIQRELPTPGEPQNRDGTQKGGTGDPIELRDFIEITPPAISEDPRARQTIRDALDGKQIEAQGGVLEDVVEIIKRRGSVLDGSILDGDAMGPAWESDPDLEPADSRPDSESRAFAAEQLLRSARLLMELPTPDADRRGLVNQMRAEAVQLLTE